MLQNMGCVGLAVNYVMVSWFCDFSHLLVIMPFCFILNNFGSKMSGTLKWQFVNTEYKAEEGESRSKDNSGKICEKSYKLLSHFPVLVEEGIQNKFIFTAKTSFQ